MKSLKNNYSVVPDVIFEEFLPFYDLAGMPGLKELPRTLDSVSDPIFVPGGLIFGDEEVTRVYVSTIGDNLFSLLFVGCIAMATLPYIWLNFIRTRY